MRLAAAFLLFFGLVAGAPPPGIKWIAHRGGVVDARYSENSPASLNAAVEHGYWMIESDIRETKDGQAITQHDPDFQRFFGDLRTVSAMTLADIRKLRANPGGTPPMTFRELADACKGRLRLMLDVKEPEHSTAFYDGIERELRRVGLLESTYVIGLNSAKKHLRGKARISVNSAELKEAASRKEDVGKLYFLFEWGKTLTREQVEFARSRGVPVVPSINTFHYGNDLNASVAAGQTDVRRLIAWGVTEFQIDSVYEPAFH